MARSLPGVPPIVRQMLGDEKGPPVHTSFVTPGPSSVKSGKKGDKRRIC